MQIWQELISAAIVRTEQQQPPRFSAVESTELQRLLTRIESDDKESALLAAWAICALWRKAGNKLTAHEKDFPEISAPETSACISDDAASIFDLISEQPNDRSLMGEFFELAAARKQLIQPGMLPKLFWRFRKEPEMQLKLLPLVGERGRWLARRNGDLRWILIHENVEEAWEIGDHEERLFALRWRREQQPNLAREMLAATWKTESAKDRQAFLEILLVNLSIADEPFLSEILTNDKSSDVRRAAFEMQLRLPDSKLGDELADRAAQILIFDKGDSAQPAKLEAVFPKDFKVAKTDVLNDLELYLNQREFGEKAVYLIKLLHSVPPEFWEKRFSAAPAAILRAAERGDWQKALFAGFKSGAANFADIDWLINISPQLDQHEHYFVTNQIRRVWTNGQLENLVARLLDDCARGSNCDLIAQYVNLIKQMLSDQFANRILDALRGAAQHETNRGREFFKPLAIWLLYSAHRIPTATLETFDAEELTKRILESDKEPNTSRLAEQFLTIIELRRRMHRVFDSN